MTTITLDTLEKVTTQPSSARDAWSVALKHTIEAMKDEQTQISRNGEFPATVLMARAEVLELIAAHPTPEQVLGYHASSLLQERVEDLLDKNSEEGLTDSERAEMDEYLQINHQVILLKASAHKAVRDFAI
jgi:hypothetical protein